MIVQAILVGLIAAWGSLDYAFGTLYTFRPIVLGPLVGLALGDVKTGVEIGASLELLFMGAISVGAYIPPDVNIGGVLATAFATSYKFLLAFGAFYIGADKVQDLLDFIPQFILDGMGVAAGILPAMGFAMLMRMIINKKLIPFFFLGFVLASYANIPVLGVAIIAVIIAVEKFGFLEGKPQLAGNAEEVDDDDDF